MASTSVTISMDEELKKQGEMVLDDMGLTMTTAFTLFMKTVVRKNKIPFKIEADPFWCEANQARLKQSIANLNAGVNTVEKTMEELEAMADGV